MGERKDPTIYAHWIEDDYAYNHCSNCGWEWNEREYATSYCPNCGATMIEDSCNDQMIVTWFTPEKKDPPEGKDLAITFSGTVVDTESKVCCGKPVVSFDHELGTGRYCSERKSWEIDGFSREESDILTVDAWADLNPYRNKV